MNPKFIVNNAGASYKYNNTMKTTKHPHLDLIINEDGSEIIYKGKSLKINEYPYAGRNYTRRIVHFMSYSHSVPKLVCEAWNGMRDSPDLTVHRRDKDPENDHYTNLYWDKRGKVRTARTKRASTSKIKKEEIPDVIDRIASKEPLTSGCVR